MCFAHKHNSASSDLNPRPLDLQSGDTIRLSQNKGADQLCSFTTLTVHCPFFRNPNYLASKPFSKTVQVALC